MNIKDVDYILETCKLESTIPSYSVYSAL